MVVYLSGNGLSSTRSTSSGGSWSTPVFVTGTNASSRNQSLTYKSNSPAYYKLVWDEPFGANGKILFREWSGSAWVNPKQVNGGTIGTITAEAKPTISVTSTNVLDIAWQGVKALTGNGVIVHNRNLSTTVYTVFEGPPLLPYSNPSITGHVGGRASLVWQRSDGIIYKATHNGVGWSTPTSIGNNGSNPATSILNPAGGNARVVWTEGTASPYTVTLYPLVLNRSGADSAFEFHREIIVRDTASEAFVSFELGSLAMTYNNGAKEMLDFVPVNDTLSYEPSELLDLLETEPFTIPSGVTSISVTRSILGDTPNRFFSEATTRFELVNTATGLVVASFGVRELDGLDSTLSVSDSVSLSITRLPFVSFKVRTVVDGLDLTDPGLSAAVVNIFISTGEEEGMGKTPSLAQPATYFLSQNYPNPFNPTTTIKYELPSDSPVSLKVYDVLGREVLKLVDGVERSGSHEVVLNASDLSSGVYFYRLKAGDFMDTKRLLLLK